MNREAKPELPDVGVDVRVAHRKPVPEGRETHVLPDPDVPSETEHHAHAELGVAGVTHRPESEAAVEKEAGGANRIETHPRIESADGERLAQNRLGKAGGPDPEEHAIAHDPAK